MMARTHGKPALALVLLLPLLAACRHESPADSTAADPASAPAATTSAPAAEASADDTACLIGANWQLDVQDSANQLKDYLGSNGLAVQSAEGVGSHQLTFTGDGLVSSDIDVSYTISIAMDEGLTMTMVQTQGGASGGEWAWQGNSGLIGFENWDAGTYSIQTQTFINDIASPSSMSLPGESLDSATLEVLACTPDMLSTHATGSPFTQLWHPAS